MIPDSGLEPIRRAVRFDPVLDLPEAIELGLLVHGETIPLASLEELLHARRRAERQDRSRTSVAREQVDDRRR
jgi:hypothetical protein